MSTEPFSLNHVEQQVFKTSYISRTCVILKLLSLSSRKITTSQDNNKNFQVLKCDSGK